MQGGRAASPPAHAPAHPLVRQATSLGSFDLLKLFELGPDGEPLNIMDVLAQNPDWAEQHADQSLDAGGPGSARPLESSRNPGGGAEPPDGSLLEEALKLTGPVQPPAPVAAPPEAARPPHRPSQHLQPQQPPQLLVTQTSLARLLSAGRSDSLQELVKRPSLTSQLSRDPSFTSAVFNQLLSQRSEDQAMLLSILGLEQVGTPPPLLPGSQAAGAARPSLPQPLQHHPLPRLQVARHSGPALNISSGQAGAPHGPLLTTPQPQQLQPPRAVLDSKVIQQRSAGRPPPAPVRPQAGATRGGGGGGGGGQPWQLATAPQAPGAAARQPAAALPDNRSLEQRVGSLSYMLDAAKALPGATARGSQAAALPPASISFRLPPGSLAQSAALWRAPAPATPGAADGRSAAAARPQPRPNCHGTVIQTPQQRAAAGLPSLAVPGPQELRVVTGSPGSCGFPAASTPPAGTPVVSGLPPRPPPTSAAAPATPQLPAAAAAASAGASAALARAPQATPPLASTGPQSSFLSGLITGIRPPALGVGPAAASAAAAAVAGLPAPVVAPLPPLPGVPSIAEYQHRLVGGLPGARPRLEVLPLLGTATPQVAPVRLDFSPAAAAGSRPSSAAAQSAAALKAGNGFLKSWLGGGGVKLPTSAGLGGSAAAAAAAAAAGAAAANGAAVRPRAAASSGAESASSGSLGGSNRGAKRPRAPAAEAGGKELRARAASRGSAGSRQPSEEPDSGDEEMPAADRREQRKAKNRASAAASRARREAYTASLEEQVARLQAEQAWLKQQVAAQAAAAQEQPRRPAGRAPQRQLSI